MSSQTRQIEVLSFGESLVDFLPRRRGVSLRDVDRFRKVVGGAPTNLALGLAKLGTDAALSGKIGRDEFGEFIVESLESTGVDTRGVVRTDEAQTGLTFVTLEEDGDRSFLFYRDPSADMLLRADDIDRSIIAAARMFQVGSNLLTQPGVREATEEALEAAHDTDCAVSVDPNVRIHLWDSPGHARRAVLDQLEGASIAKVNEEELELLAPDVEPGEAWREVVAPLGVDIFVVTLGPDGAVLFAGDERATAAARDVEVVDTTGAGDGFMSGFLATLAARLRSESPNRNWRNAIPTLELDALENALEVGTWVGTEVCTELGATPPLPDLEQLPDELSHRLDP